MHNNNNVANDARPTIFNFGAGTATYNAPVTVINVSGDYYGPKPTNQCTTRDNVTAHLTHEEARVQEEEVLLSNTWLLPPGDL